METQYVLDGINIEVTNACPLRCPQCYCTLEGGKHIPLEKVRELLLEGAKMGMSHVEFSGGETLCYPHITEAIKLAAELDLSPSIAISGWGFDETTYDKLIEAGLDCIHVSLNASTKERNALSRDGFELSIAALELLKEKGFPNVIINWVMHRDTVDELPKMVALAEKYNVSSLLVIDPKPNSKNELNSYPTAEQLKSVAKLIKGNTSSVEIEVHHCFSVLAALVGENKLWGNLNRGIYQGCTAGLCSLSIDVEGNVMPCRHLPYAESCYSLKNYWENSPLLEKIRGLNVCRRHPCDSCRLSKYCRHCLAINAKIHNDLYIGNEFCPIYQEQ